MHLWKPILIIHGCEMNAWANKILVGNSSVYSFIIHVYKTEHIMNTQPSFYSWKSANKTLYT